MNTLKKWEEATKELTKEFVLKYFDKDADYYWVGNDCSGILSVNDYFFNLNRVVEALRYNATEKQFFRYYDDELDCDFKNIPMKINFKNFLKYGKIKENKKANKKTKEKGKLLQE